MRPDRKLNYDEWPNLSEVALEEYPHVNQDDRPRFPDGDPIGPLPRPTQSRLSKLAIVSGVFLLLLALSLRAVSASESETVCADLQREVTRLRAELVGVRALCGARCRPAR